MNTIFTVIKKEIIDMLRDRKTLISAIILPALAMPLMIMGVTKLQSNLIGKESTKQLTIALYNAPAPVEQLFGDKNITLVKNVPLANAKDSVAQETYDAILAFDDHFSSSIDSLRTGDVSFYFKSTNIMVEKRVTEYLDSYEQGIIAGRLKSLNLSEEIIKPIAVKNMDVASKKEQIGLLVGGFLPYIFIIFCFMGCMYPALDLLTGEKEKGTIETLLTVPASRFDILIGKMITISIIGVCAAFMTIAGLFVALKMMNEIPEAILTTINDILSVKFMLMLFAMLIPLSLFFAGILSAVAIRASSFKEAQSYATPLTFVVIIPAMIALMPGIKLNWQTVFIPILNIALATKEIIAGTIHNGQYIVIVCSLIFYALLAAMVSIRQFSNEKNILK